MDPSKLAKVPWPQFAEAFRHMAAIPCYSRLEAIALCLAVLCDGWSMW